MRIGISLLTEENLGIWSNGITQNVFHLARLLTSLPFVEQVYLLNCGNQGALPADTGEVAQTFPLVRPREATDLVDVVIELAGGLDPEWLALMRARGAKVIFYVCGHPYSALIDPTVFKTAGYFAKADRCDEVWLLDQYALFASLMETLHRCPVRTVPHLWGPDFVAQRCAEVRKAGLTPGIAEGQTSWPKGGLRVAVFEPNISHSKFCAMPMLVCDAAARRSSEAIATMLVCNALQMKEQRTFQYLVQSLDLQKSNRAFFEHRHDFPGFMAQHGDAVLSHQWNHGTNYLYYDALYLGYPLIHNSPYAREVGYYYPEFDVGAGASALLQAHAHHLSQLTDYRARAERYLAALHPLNEDNRRFHARALIELTGRAT